MGEILKDSPYMFPEGNVHLGLNTNGDQFGCLIELNIF